MKNQNPTLRPVLFVTIFFVGIFPSGSANAITKLEPKQIVFALENSTYTQPHQGSIRRFSGHFLDSIPLGLKVSLYEFGSQVRPLGTTNKLTRRDVIELKRRLSRSPGHDRFVDYKNLALNLYSYSYRPTSVIVITSGMSCLVEGQSFVDPFSPLMEIFPEGRGHMLLFCGVTNSLTTRRNLPGHMHTFPIDRDTLPVFKKEFFFNRILLPNPTWTPSRTATRRPTNTPKPTFTPSPQPTSTRTATFTHSPTHTEKPSSTSTPSFTPTDTATKQPSPTPTATQTNTMTPSPTPSPTEWIVVPIAEIDEGDSPAVGSPPQRIGLRPGIIALLITTLVLLLVYKRLLNSRVQQNQLEEVQEEPVLKCEIILNRKDGTEIDNREVLVEDDCREISMGRSAKANWFRPELARDLKLKIYRDGRLQKWAGFYWQELFPGDQISLEDGLNLGWSFEWIPREELQAGDR